MKKKLIGKKSHNVFMLEWTKQQLGISVVHMLDKPHFKILYGGSLFYIFRYKSCCVFFGVLKDLMILEMYLVFFVGLMKGS